MLSNGTRGVGFPAYFELLPWETFPVFTQRTSCHFITRRFTYFLSNPNQRRISAYLHRPIVLLKTKVWGRYSLVKLSLDLHVYHLAPPIQSACTLQVRQRRLCWKRIAALLDYETKAGEVTRRGTVEGWRGGEVNF